MDSLLICLNAVLPMFLLMALGYLAQRMRILGQTTVLKMNKVVFAIFLPAMIFNNLYASDFASSFKPDLMVYTALTILLFFTLSTLIVNKLVTIPAKQGVLVQGLFRSNYMMIGLALAANFLPANELGCVSLMMVVVIPLFNILAVITLATHTGGKVSWKKTLLDIIKNPLIIATLLGILAAATGIKLPTPVESAVSQLGEAAAPVVLFLLGGFFSFKSLPTYKKDLICVCIGRLVLIPGATLAGGIVLGFDHAAMITLVAIFGSPTATASFPMAAAMGGDAELAGDIVVATSTLCSFTLFAWCFALMSLGFL